MKFGKTENYQAVDFIEIASFKVDTSLLSQSKKQQTNVYLGATGWSNPTWKNLIYPAKTASSQFLHHYSKQFKTIELNSTFYGIPTLEKIEKWLNDTPKDFKFCPKFPQSLSHRKDFGQSSGALIKWFEALDHLKEKLGSTFIQFPNYYDIGKLKNQIAHLARFSESFPLTVELRNENCYKREQFESIKRLCSEHNIGLVITDVAGNRAIYHHTFLQNHLIIRWVGNEDNLHNQKRLEHLKNLIVSWSQVGHFDLYFMVHHPDINQVPKTCQSFTNLFKDSTNIALHPLDLISTSQASLFD